MYDPATSIYTVIEAPDAFHTNIVALDNHGRLLGHRHDWHGARRAFLWQAGTFTFLDLPDRPGAQFLGLTDSGVLAGGYGGHRLCL